MLSRCLMLIFLLASGLNAGPVSSSPLCDLEAVVSSVPVEFWVSGALESDGYIYVVGTEGAAVYDFRDLRKPVYVGGIEGLESARTLVRQDGLLYAFGAGDGGPVNRGDVAVIDISLPAAPRVIEWRRTGFAPQGRVFGDHLAVIEGSDQFVLYRPGENFGGLIAHAPPGRRFTGIARRGDLAFVLSNGGTLLVVSFGDPSNPKVLRDFPLSEGSPAGQLTVDGDRLILVRGDVVEVLSADAELRTLSRSISPRDGMTLLGIADGVLHGHLSDTGAIVLVDIEGPDGIREVGLIENTRLVSTDWSFVQVPGGSVFTRFVATGSELVVSRSIRGLTEIHRWGHTFSDGAFGLAVDGDLAYVGGRGYGLTVYRGVQTGAMERLGRIRLSNCTHVAARDGIVFAGLQTFGFRVIDTTDPQNLVQIGEYVPAAASSLGGLDLSGDLLVAMFSEGVKFFDVSQPQEPAEVGVWTDDARIHSGVIDGDLLIGASAPDGLIILDISVPSEPRKIGELAVGGGLLRVLVNGDLVYATQSSWPDDDSFVVLDISDETNPRLVGGPIPLGRAALSLAQHENFVYVGTEYGVMVVDVADATNPIVRGEFSRRDDVSAMQFAEGRLITTANRGVVWVTDMTPCDGCGAEFGGDIGSIDGADVAAFLQAFVERNPATDLAEPFGIWNFFDFGTYLEAINQGCPE